MVIEILGICVCDWFRLLELRGLPGNIQNELDSPFARWLIQFMLNYGLHLYLMMIAFPN
jgi:hypothetical protein